MLSKNNRQLRNVVNCSTKQRFGLRKLTIGVASVLLGFTWLYAGRASADTVNVTADPAAATTQVAEASPQITETGVATISTAETVVADERTLEASTNATGSETATATEEDATELPVNGIGVAVESEQVASQPITVAPSQPVASQPTAAVSQQAPTTQAEVPTVGPIETDTLLKDKYGIDINNLDNRSVLLLASLFHIFANEANVGNDVNGNIAAGILGGNHDFGTRGESINLTQGDIYYIQQLKDALNTGSFRNEAFNHVVFGSDVKVEIRDGRVYVNDQLLANLTPEDVFKDGAGTVYIDFAKVFERLIEASDFYASQETANGVIIDFSDMNNKFIDVSKAEAVDNVIYINVPADQLSGPQEIKIFGLSSHKDAPTIVINVTGADGTVDVNTKIHLYYDGSSTPVPNGESHQVPNNILWNFGNNAAVVNIASGRFMGSILAPKGTVNVYVNVDGNIVANVVNIIGGESHRWDIQPTPEPDTPGPDNPDTPEPEKPDTPDPDKPDVPDTPEPDVPDNPEPDQPDVPDTPGPDNPDVPGPETPEEPEPTTPEGSESEVAPEVTPENSQAGSTESAEKEVAKSDQAGHQLPQLGNKALNYQAFAILALLVSLITVGWINIKKKS